MKKYRSWNKEKVVIKLKPNWRQEIIEAFKKYDIPYKKRIKELEKAIITGEAVVL